jgi:phosphoribosyl 1,2-cyclic phosphodiesterase
MIFEAISLQSGSSGNCIYVETGDCRLIFDAGLSCIETARRLAASGKDIRKVDAMIISHEHADHIRCAGAMHRKYGIPVYITRATLDAALSRVSMGRLADVRHFSAGSSISFCGSVVHTIPTPHDGADGSVFVVESCGKRLGVMTDLGHVFDALALELPRLDAVFLESNYDLQMLLKGSYPEFLKKRIQGAGGHISNRESAELLLSGSCLKWACLSHLSQHNNYPALALKTHREILGNSLTLHVADRNAATGIFKI